MKISVAQHYQSIDPTGFIPRECNSLQDFRSCFCLDHSPSLFVGNYRHGDNFISSDFLYGDIDEGCSLESFNELFSDYYFITSTSRSHQKAKKDQPPCDRFHVFFPLERPITNRAELEEKLALLHKKHPIFDKGVKDCARLLFGCRDTIVAIHPGKYLDLSDDDYIPDWVTDPEQISQDITPKDRPWNQDYVEDQETPKSDILSSHDNRLKLLQSLKTSASCGAFADWHEWLSLGAALKRGGFSLSDWQSISYPDAASQCALEWPRLTEHRNHGPEATTGSLVYWARIGVPDLFKPSVVFPSVTNPEPTKEIKRDGKILDLTERLFLEKPTHGLFVDVLTQKLKGKVIFERIGLDNERGVFYKRKEGTCYWEPCPDMKKLARQVIESKTDKMFLARKKDETLDIKKQCEIYAQIIAKARTNDFLNSTLTMFSLNVMVFPKIAWNTSQECIPCLDKVLDFTCEAPFIRDANEGEYFMNPVPCNAEDILRAEKSIVFDEFIDGLFSDKDTQKTARHCMALCISGVANKAAQIWYNRAGNAGKNTVYDFLARLVPGRISMLKAAVITAQGDAGERRFGEADAEGKTGIFFDELSAELDVCQIKKLTGLSEIRGERKGQQPFSFQQTWALVMLCNRLPRFKPANDPAFLDRVMVLPFSSVFYQNEDIRQSKLLAGVKEEDLKPAGDKEQIIQTLLKDRPAILRSLIDSWIDCRDNYGKYPYQSKECRHAGRDYKRDNDEVARFFEECFVRGEPYDTVKYEDVREQWIEFTGSQRWDGLRWLIKELTDKYSFIVRGQSGHGRVLKGLRIKEA